MPVWSKPLLIVNLCVSIARAWMLEEFANGGKFLQGEKLSVQNFTLHVLVLS